MVDFIKCLTKVEDYGVRPGSTFEGVEEICRRGEELSNAGAHPSEAVLEMLDPAVLVQVRMDG